MSPRALVTGASGMLGGYIGDALRAGGWEVRALVRSPEAEPAVRERGFQPVRGSLEDGAALREAANGCDAVFHAAAAIGSGRDLAPFRRDNVVGTRLVLEAAAAAHARLVHVSSTAVYGGKRYDNPPTEEDVSLPTLPAEDAYWRSKQESEAEVLAAAREGRVWAAVVRPPMMYGVRDRQLVPRIAPVLMRGVFPLIAGGRTTLPMVHARNVADGAVLAAGRDSAQGRVFLLADDFPLTLAQFLEGASRGLGRRITTVPVPRGMGRLGFDALGLGLRVCGRADLARHARGMFETLTRGNPFTSRRARAELGWTPSVHHQQGLEEAFAWWRRASGGPP